MTILLAAILGNVGAWMVHGLTWRWRERAVLSISLLGMLCAFFLALGTWTMTETTLYWAHLHAIRQKKPYDSGGLWSLLIGEGVLWLLLIALGFWHRRFLRKEQGEVIWLAFFAIFTETAIAILLFLRFTLIPISNQAEMQAHDVFSLVFWNTWLLLTIFRPLVARYSQRFWKLIRPERIEPTP